MTKDLLRDATRALRDMEDVSELEARATRARIMSGLHQTRVKRRTRYAFLLPIAATFVAASAWGAASGKAQLVWQSIEQFVSKPAAPAVVAKPVSTLGKAAPVTRASAEPSAAPDIASPAPETTPPAADTVTPAADTAKAADTSLTAKPHPAVSAALPAPSSKVAVTDAHSPSPQTPEERADPTLALYRVAHTAHFVDHDPARAVSAWDAYLAAAPNGTFAPEARYNRALSLVRLGRNTEAKTALEPFANGVYGGYRQSEARALLQQLGD